MRTQERISPGMWCEVRALGCASFLGLLAACQPPPQPQAELPSITSIRSAIPETPEDSDTLVSSTDHQATVLVQRIALPMDVSTDEAWAVVDENRFPRLTRGVWNGNGLRIGLLAENDVERFTSALPEPVHIGSKQLAVSEHPAILAESRRLRGQISVDLTVPPFAAREESVTGGRARLLTHARHTEHGIALHLTPQHHLPTHSFDARSPLEKRLDGRLFEELALAVQTRPDACIVLGLYRPWPKPLAITPDKTASTDETDPPGESTPPAPPPLPAHLGHAVFTDRIFKRETQILLIMTVRRINAPNAAGNLFSPAATADR